MKLTLAEPRFLKDSISIISELVNEASFKVTKEGIELVAMDPANVAMVVFKLLSSTFIEYDVPEDVNLAVNLSNMKQILKRAKPNDMLTLELSENKLLITLKGNSKRMFSLPIIDLEEKEQKVPDLQFPLAITTSTAHFNDAVEDVDIIGESVSLVGEREKFSIIAEGDMSKAHVEIPADDETSIAMQSDEKIKAKYSIEYLKKMISAGKLCPNVTVRFNADYPLKLEYKVIDRLMLNFILAPRVEND